MKWNSRGQERAPKVEKLSPPAKAQERAVGPVKGVGEALQAAVDLVDDDIEAMAEEANGE